MPRFVWTAACVVVLTLGLVAPSAIAQQNVAPGAAIPGAVSPEGNSQAVPSAAPSSGLQAAMALEDVLVKAIADSERSVVAIARVRRLDRDLLDQIDQRQDLFGLSGRVPGPADPDFIPNEYATGVVVDAKGLILTAHHVLRENCDYWITTGSRKTYKVQQIKAADPRSDLAVLSIKVRDGELEPIKFGDAAGLKKGQIVLALGNPYGIARDGQVSASWGIISNLSRKDGPWTTDRETRNSKPTLHHYGSLIQTDVKLNLGTSGGALVNLKGEMIGLTVSLAAGLGYEQAAGFALPVDETFRRAVETLKQGQEVEYGFLGVQPEAVRPDGADHGVLVTLKVPGSPADRFGLQKDDKITHVNDQPIYSADDLMLHIGKLPPEASVRLTVVRDGRPRQLPILELSKYPVTGHKVVTNLPPAWRGIRIDYVMPMREFNPTERMRVQAQMDVQGAVVITEVEEDSPAWNEGLRTGMMISHVAGNRVSNPKQFREQVAGKTGPVKIKLTLPTGEKPERTIAPAESG